jgi:hypothetical protein
VLDLIPLGKEHIRRRGDVLARTAVMSDYEPRSGHCERCVAIATEQLVGYRRVDWPVEQDRHVPTFLLEPTAQLTKRSRIRERIDRSTIA